MKIVFLYLFTLLFILKKSNAQDFKVTYIKDFIKQLKADAPVDSLKKYVLISNYKKRKEKKLANRQFVGLVVAEKKNLDTLLSGNNIFKFEVVPYLKLDKDQRILFCPKSPDRYDNIYGIVLGDKILTYYLLDNDKIASFFYISKGHYANGKNDCS
ncbi:MAG: hypothetical protein NTZ59_07260 [Bacteroidetes bacterium]|nr:hypothetical protein [Bacteroidota bacterium]